jgi:hypothetical protein
MLPINNNDPAPCTPISSNCVIWQGPDIACIDLCNGDTISDIVNKLALELCAIIDETCTCNPDLSGLTLAACIPATTPLNLDSVLEAIMTQLCTVVAPEVEIPWLVLPECLWFTDGSGQLWKEAPMWSTGYAVSWVGIVSTKICSIVTQIDQLYAITVSIATRITALEICAGCVPGGGGGFPGGGGTTGTSLTNVVSSYFFPGVLTPVSTLTLAIESSLGEFITAVGSRSAVSTAISAQALSSSTISLSSTASYGSLANWVINPSNLAQSHQDQWVVLGDVYSAVRDIQDNFISSGCESVNFGFTYNVVNDAANLPITLNLNFTSCTIPPSYSDCGGGSLVTLTDSNGSSTTSTVNVTNLQNNPSGANIDLSGLNVLNSITVQIDFCATDGINMCQEKNTQIVPLQIPCPTDIAAVSITDDAATIQFTNSLGTTVEYKIEIIDVSTLAVVGTTTLINPIINISKVFTGLASGTDYTINVTITSSGVPITCSPQAFTTTGVNCATFSTTNTGLAGLNDIYLGYTYAGTVQTTYHYNPDLQNIVVGTPATPACYGPKFTSYSIDSMTGNVTLNLSYGLVVGIAIVIDSSTDGITYSNVNTGIDGVRIYTSGVTSGSIYVRAHTTCTGPITSEYSILRYDFKTTQWQIIQSPSDCHNLEIANGCPAGVQVARQNLTCDAVSYTPFGGTINSYWYFIRKYVRSGITIYVYAGWTQASGVTSILECCICPAFVLTDTMRLYCQEGGTIAINIPYALGDGNPVITAQSTTINGTLTQAAVGSHQFSYTHITSSDSYADTFQVQIAPDITADCGSSIATIQIQIIPCDISMKYLDQPIFVFIDTNVYTSAQGANIKTGMLATIAAWNTAWSYTGNLYFIPTTSSRWLGYQKAIVDDGVSASLDPAAAWVALRLLPTSWSAGAPIYKNKAFLLALSNESATDYHAATLAAGFATVIQPTVTYLDDYNAYNDALNGTRFTTWATGLSLFNNQYPDGFSGVYYPFVTKLSTAADAAAVLMSLAAYVGEMIPPTQYGIKTMVDVTGYLMQGLIPSATNPYQGATPPTGPTIEGLYKKGWLVYLNNEYKTTTYAGIAAGTDDQWTNQLDLAAQLCGGTYPLTSIGTLRYQLSRCDTGATELVHITTPGLYPAYGTFYKSLAANNSLSTDVCFRFTGYGVGTAIWEFGTAISTETGCEGCGAIFLVQDCQSTDQYKVNFGATVGIGIGFVYKVQNTGASFVPGDGRDNWDNNEEKCLTIVSAAAAAEIATATITFYSDCETCVVTL